MIQQEKRAFDAGAKVWVQRYENLRNLAHWHFEDELVVCQGGEVRLMLNGGFYDLAKGDCAFVSRESVHSIAGAPGSRAAVAQFGTLFDAPLRLRAPVFADRYRAGERLDELDRECREKRPFYAEKMFQFRHVREHCFTERFVIRDADFNADSTLLDKGEQNQMVSRRLDAEVRPMLS